MVKMVSRIVFLALVVFCLFTFSYPADTFALWAKRFDNNGWNDFGGIWPSESGGYYLWGLTSDPFEPDETRKDYLLLSKLDHPELFSGPRKSTRGIMTPFLSANSGGTVSFFRA